MTPVMTVSVAPHGRSRTRDHHGGSILTQRFLLCMQQGASSSASKPRLVLLQGPPTACRSRKASGSARSHAQKAPRRSWWDLKAPQSPPERRRTDPCSCTIPHGRKHRQQMIHASVPASDPRNNAVTSSTEQHSRQTPPCLEPGIQSRRS